MRVSEHESERERVKVDTPSTLTASPLAAMAVVIPVQP